MRTVTKPAPTNSGIKIIMRTVVNLAPPKREARKVNMNCY